MQPQTDEPMTAMTRDHGDVGDLLVRRDGAGCARFQRHLPHFLF